MNLTNFIRFAMVCNLCEFPWPRRLIGLSIHQNSEVCIVLFHSLNSYSFNVSLGVAGFHVWMWTGVTANLLDLISLTNRLFQYPAYDSFVDSVREEAIQNVKRIRHHPSVVIFGV